MRPLHNGFSRWTSFLSLAIGGSALLLGCSAAPVDGGGSVEATEVRHDNLFVSSSTVWPSPTIPVCWVNAVDADVPAMGWTRDAVAMTWEGVSNVRFTGWGDCDGATTGIRIQIADENPYSYVGTGGNNNGKAHSMVLDFTFANWSQVCQGDLEHCVRAIAVHEFGHALGFDHEQNRPDSPEWCAKDTQGSGDTVIGPWDLDSVMNYCNPKWNGDGYLSPIDIEGVQQIYGKPNYGSACGHLPAGEGLGKDQHLTSCDGRFDLVMQGDGNLVLYQAGKGALWATNTLGKGGNIALMQDDGNFVLYGDGGALWASGTQGHSNGELVVQDDGNLVVYADGKPLWGSNTCCH